jgi:hypothetical protein
MGYSRTILFPGHDTGSKYTGTLEICLDAHFGELQLNNNGYNGGRNLRQIYLNAMRRKNLSI